MPVGVKVGLGPRYIVLDGDPASIPKREHRAPNIRPMFIVARRLDGSIKMPLGTMVGIGPGNNVLDADPALHQGHSPLKNKNRPMSCCGQTAGWIKMSLGTKVGLGPGRTVLHVDPALPSQRSTALQFSAHVYCGQTVAHVS